MEQIVACGPCGEGRAGGAPASPLRLLLLLLWIGRYYLVLGASGLYTAVMLLEHYTGIVMLLSSQTMVDEHRLTKEQVFLLEVMEFFLWMFGSWCVWGLLRAYRFVLERRLRHGQRA